MHGILLEWPPVEATEALELLDPTIPDEMGRAIGVLCLSAVPDDRLADFLIQLVQALKAEPLHNSMLARFLLRRAFRAPHIIGQHLFWLLMSEMHHAATSQRFAVLLRVYLRLNPHHASRLLLQTRFNQLLEGVALGAQKQKKAHRTTWAKEQLAVVNGLLKEPFELALSMRYRCRDIEVEECKVMDSKKAPLWIVARNAEAAAPPIVLIFKAGDDLRQDQVTLQMLREMDRVWCSHNYRVYLKPYACCCTGYELGMIEVVPNSTTTAYIQAKYGGKMKGAWMKSPIDNYLREHNEGEKYEEAVDTFLHSCAAYCVATFLLGIGDRHPSNIMIDKAGCLFHIVSEGALPCIAPLTPLMPCRIPFALQDFGHFLGNFKAKVLMGGAVRIRRERTPFVFTKQMAYVLGRKRTEGRYKQFEEV